MGKNNFIFYNEYKEQLELLSDEQRGRLLMALVEYSTTGEILELDALTKMLFLSMRSQMDRDSEKYERVCERNKKNGKSGGRPAKKENPENPENPVGYLGYSKNPESPVGYLGFSEKPKKPDNDNEYDNDNDDVNDINNNSLHIADALFERLWKRYPNKKGKARVSDAKKKEMLKHGEDQMNRALDRYLDGLKQDEWRKPQDGRTFFCGGYVDYLDANYEKPAPVKKQNKANFQQRDVDYSAIERQAIMNINARGG